MAALKPKAFNAKRHVADGLVHLAQKILVAVTLGAWVHRTDTVTEVPDTGKMLERRLRAACRPFHITLRRAVAQDKPARGVRPIGADDIDRIDHVLLGFRHLGRGDDFHFLQQQSSTVFCEELAAILVQQETTFDESFPIFPDYILGQMIDRAAIAVAGLVDLMGHHALGEKRVEGLDRRRRQMPGDVHRAGKEPAVEQVQDRVFDAADILIDIHPVLGLGHLGRRLGPGRGEAGEIPRTVHERVHRVGFAPGRFTAFRAGTVSPCRVPVERVAGDVETVTSSGS